MHLTPQLRQAVKILQLSTPELWEYIKQELDDNPALEYDGDDRWSWTGTGEARDNDYDPLTLAVSNEVSLERHLTEQLHFIKEISLPIRKLIRYMIGNLDRNGYLEPSLDEIANTLRADPALAEQALSVLQGFDPAGVAARNLKECLSIQAGRIPDCPPLVPVLIDSHLEDIANNRIHKLAAQLKVLPEQIRDAVNVIKRLNPRPGASFHPGEIKYIVPDVSIELTGERLEVRIADAAAPRLSVNAAYQQMLRESGRNQEARRFLQEKINAAAFFKRCVEQRRPTLFRVIEAIAVEQIEFLEHGVSRLKPLTLRRIAEKVGLHESTVSRATAGKYAQTPWGLFELAFFFPSGLDTDAGETASSISVKERLKERIHQEDCRKPYSDQQLADLLAKDGIRISRRTVAKYREQLGIGSSAQRKQL